MKALLDIQDLCRRVLPDSQIAIIKELDGGRSDARVLIVDIVTPPPEGDGRLNGQFILKAGPNSPWPGEVPEAARHLAARSRNATFSSRHIPELRFSTETEGISVLVYDIAGHSLSGFVGADAVDVGSLSHYGSIVSTGLLEEWNTNYQVKHSSSATETLRTWLGYRLNPADAPDLHKFVAQYTSDQPLFICGGRALVNPLWLAKSDLSTLSAAAVSFHGLIHSDLHPGNILVDRTRSNAENYWLIDFALSREAPLTFDHSYWELSLLLGQLDGADPHRLLTVLEALEADDGTPEATRIQPQDLGIAGCARTIRHTMLAWQQRHETTRADSFLAQVLLARIAVGLNWANKPIGDSRQKLALAYAAKAATLLLERFAEALLQEIQAVSTNVDQRPAAVTPAWPDVWDQLSSFDSSRASYILVAGRLPTHEAISSLGLLPWSAVVDFDPQSNESGLHSCIASTLGKLRSVNQFGLTSQPIDIERGTAWLMANGWPSRFEPTPTDFRRWRTTYGDRLRQLCGLLRRATSPLPVKVLILATPDLPREYVRSAVAFIDEALENSSDITVIGAIAPLDDQGIKAHYQIDVDDFASALYRVVGGNVFATPPTIPGSEGAQTLEISHLRNLAEDLDVLHSRALENSPSDSRADSFWRGNPPTWLDLHSNADVRRDLGPRLAGRVRDLLEARGNYTVELTHAPGAGGTTAALRCAWDIRRDFPVAILRRYSGTTADRVDQLFRLSQKPVLLVVEAALVSRAQREELNREIARRNVRCVILYVVRLIGDRSSSDPNKFAITDPMTQSEAEAFREAFSSRTSNPRRQQLLAKLANAPEFRAYLTPFFFGLVTYEEAFERVDSYVTSYRKDLKPEVSEVIRLIALATRFSQTGPTSAFVKSLLGLRADSQVDVASALGDAGGRLAIVRGDRARLLHPLIAEEFLRQELGGPTQWIHGLKDQSIAFIARVSEQLGPDTDESQHLYESLFIRRDFWTSKIRLRRNFSELILKIPTPAGQHLVLQRLTEVCPDEPHYWNHLGRHHIYEMRQDFAAAEGYLKKAVELDESDQIHHHALGMVRRFWIRSSIADQLRSREDRSPEQLLESVRSLFDGAAEEFGATRELAPEDDHGYITHIQLIIEVLEGLVRVGSGGTLATLSSDGANVGDWVRNAIVVAEDLLSRVQQMRQKPTPGRYELNCTTRLATLYGHFDALVGSLQSLNVSTDDPNVRRALATAYYSRSGRSWQNMSSDELSETKELMESNLRADPANDGDIRRWFQAFRRIPEFSYVEAIDRLESWASVSKAVDAFYYLYILHFLRWRDGAERDEDALQQNLDECRQRSTGVRGRSYEWLGNEPSWCPLVHVSELGERPRDQEFYENTAPLKRIQGKIDSIKGPQAGQIRLGPRTVAFFLPGTKFSESRHLNALVDFYIGFSYDGLRAWVPDFVEEKAKLGDVVQSPERGPRELAAHAAASVPTEPLRRRVESMVRDQVVNARNRGGPLFVATLGSKLKETFGAPSVYERLGHSSLKALLGSMSFLRVIESSSGGETVELAATSIQARVPSAEKDAPIARLTSQPSASTTGNLDDVKAFILAQVEDAEKAKRNLATATLALHLIKRFGQPPVHQRLGFAKLRRLIESVAGLGLDPSGHTVVRVRPSPPKESENPELQKFIREALTLAKRRTTLEVLSVMIAKRFGIDFIPTDNLERLKDILNNIPGVKVDSADNAVSLTD